MLKLKIASALSVLFLSAFFVPAYSMDKSKSVDELFKSVDLIKLINKNQTVNLQAQMSDPLASSMYINDLTEFTAIGVVFNEEDKGSTFVTRFDENQNILQKISHPAPWLGVQEFSQKEIPALSLQEGLELAKSCMADKGEPVSDQIARVTIYKTIRSSQVVYDYGFKDANLSPFLCQEVLYTPETGDCQKGMISSCHFIVSYAIKKIK
jgi:hypothetical protein